MLWGGDTLGLLHWSRMWLMMIIWCDPSMFHGAVGPWSLHIYHYEAPQRQGPQFLPTRKNHNPHPQGGEGKGVKMGTLHWGWGGPAKPGLYISSHGGTLPLVGEVDLGWALHWPNALHFSVSLLTDGEPGQKSKCHLQFWCHQACIFICIYIYT